MTTIDMKLAERGQRVSRIGLLDQGRYHLKLEALYRDALRAVGWRPEQTAEMAAHLELLDTQHAEAIEARADSKGDRRREQSAIDDAKACKRKLVVAFTDLHADGLVTPEDFDIVRKSGDLKRSPPRISAYLADVRKPVAKYKELLTPFVDGRCPLALIDAVKAELDSAQGIQEINLATLPLETLKVYERKGRLLMLIEKMNRRGKIAFDGQAEILGRFNKDLLLRARKLLRAKSTIEAAEPSGDIPGNGEERSA